MSQGTAATVRWPGRRRPKPAMAGVGRRHGATAPTLVLLNVHDWKNRGYGRSNRFKFSGVKKERAMPVLFRIFQCFSLNFRNLRNVYVAF